FEIADPPIHRNIDRVALRQSRAAPVVSNEFVSTGHPQNEVAPHREPNPAGGRWQCGQCARCSSRAAKAEIESSPACRATARRTKTHMESKPWAHGGTAKRILNSWM